MKKVSKKQTGKEEITSADDSGRVPTVDSVCSTTLTPASTKRPDGVLGRLARVDSGAVVGVGCQIGDFVRVPEWVVLEEDVLIGIGVVFVDRVKPQGERYYGEKIKTTTTIMAGAVIGANSVIQRGVTIGRSAWIAPGTVLSKDIPDYNTAHGSPGRLAAFVCPCGHALPFHRELASDSTHCPGCRRPYHLRRGVVYEANSREHRRVRKELEIVDSERKNRITDAGIAVLAARLQGS